MVHEAVWLAAGMNLYTPEVGSGFLCVGCIEKRLGRELTHADFPDYPINWPDPWDTPRLAARKVS